MTSSLLTPPAPIATAAPEPGLRWVRYEPPAAVDEGPGFSGSGYAGSPPAISVRSVSAGVVGPGRVHRGPPGAAAAAERIEAHHAAARQLRTALEVLDGRRPAAQLTGLVAPPVLRYWRAAAAHRRPLGPARCGRLRVCLPSSGVAEVAVTCEIDGRVRALAARFERRRGRWWCTALRLG